MTPTPLDSSIAPPLGPHILGTTTQPSPPPAGRVSLAMASESLGISREGVRLRIKRGQLDAVKIDGQWWIALPDSPPAPPTSSPTGTPHVGPQWEPTRVPTKVVAQLEAENAFLRQECERLHQLLQTETARFHEVLRAEQEAHRRDASELHVLLQRAQAQIPLPTAAAQPTAAPPAESVEHRRRWWWPW